MSIRYIDPTNESQKHKKKKYEMNQNESFIDLSTFSNRERDGKSHV
jgi:hypothetical protein